MLAVALSVAGLGLSHLVKSEVVQVQDTLQNKTGCSCFKTSTGFTPNHEPGSVCLSSPLAVL